MTTRTGRTPTSTTRTRRTLLTKWLDYLFGDNQWTSAIVEDENWPISIYADSWYEEVSSWTSRTKRTPVI